MAVRDRSGNPLHVVFSSIEPLLERVMCAPLRVPKGVLHNHNSCMQHESLVKWLVDVGLPPGAGVSADNSVAGELVLTVFACRTCSLDLFDPVCKGDLTYFQSSLSSGISFDSGRTFPGLCVSFPVVRSGPGAARTILLFDIISARTSKQSLVVRTTMEIGCYFLFVQDQTKTSSSSTSVSSFL
jgi:hypothetical protein